MSCKMKVKKLIPLLMEIHQVLYRNAYNKAKVLVDVDWVKKETLRKNAIIKHKCLNDPEYLERKMANSLAYYHLNKMRAELF